MITESDFWGIVDDIGWGRKTTNYYGIAERLALMWGPEKCNAVRDMFIKFRNKLAVKLEGWERDTKEHFDVSSDGMDDLTSHIVGLGEEEYTNTMENPFLAKQRADRHAYVESFAYAIPYSTIFEDWRRLPQNLVKLQNEISNLTEEAPEYSRVFQELSAMINQSVFLTGKQNPITIRDYFANRVKSVAQTTGKQYAFVYDFFNSWHWINYFNDAIKWEDAKREVGDKMWQETKPEPAPLPPTALVFFKVLDVSTAHITEADSELLNASKYKDIGFPVDCLRYGYLLNVNPEEIPAITLSQFSSDFQAVIKFAIELEADVIKFDPDGTTYTQLHTNDW